MSRILVITSSISGENSVSNQLVAGAVDALRRSHPEAAVIARDLAKDPLPHLSAEALAAFQGTTATSAQAAARTLSDTVIAEVQAADTLVIGAPMYNFGIPSNLKAWFDHLLRAGVTFRYTEAGPQGLLTGKRAFVVLTRGGLYSEGPAQPMDAQEPHLRALLNFIGIEDVAYVRSERLAMGANLRAQAIDAARGQLDRAIEDRLRGAA